MHGYRPLVVIISATTGNISSKISSHYLQTHHKRWDRLDDNQTWIYLDLYFPLHALGSNLGCNKAESECTN
jgi:hypothetical protein